MNIRKLFMRNRNFTLLIMFLLLAATMSACSINTNEQPKDSDTPQIDFNSIPIFNGEKAKVMSYVFTIQKELSLTFNGLADYDKMVELLDLLDKESIKATFFVPGLRVAEEPDLIQLINNRGHHVENNTLTGKDLTQMDYTNVYKEIYLTNQLIEDATGRKPHYLRTSSGFYDDQVLLAAAHNNMDRVITYSLNLHSWKDENELEKIEYLRKYINRGGIIALDVEKHNDLLPTVKKIAELAQKINYRFVPLEQLSSDGKGERKPLEEIKGYDDAAIQPNYTNAKFNVVEKGKAGKNRVAITFDDWGTDFAVTPILDMLDKYKIKASFFLRANGVEHNPNLASAMLEAGHDVANHTYTHPVITSLTPQEVQEEVVKAHQVITEAIQQKPAMLFRPPTGEFDEHTAKAIAATGYKTIAMYNITTLDWEKDHSAKMISDIVLREVKDGSIILLHMLDDIHTIEALPTIIEGLQNKGYDIVPMSEMVE